MRKAANKDCLRRAGKLPADKVLTPDNRRSAPAFQPFLHRAAAVDKDPLLDIPLSAQACLYLHTAAEEDTEQMPDSRRFAQVPLTLPDRAVGWNKDSAPFFRKRHFLADDTMEWSAGFEDDSGQSGLPEDAPRWYHLAQAAESAGWCFRNDHHNHFPALLRPPFPSTLKALPMSHHR